MEEKETEHFTCQRIPPGAWLQWGQEWEKHGGGVVCETGELHCTGAKEAARQQYLHVLCLETLVEGGTRSSQNFIWALCAGITPDNDWRILWGA